MPLSTLTVKGQVTIPKAVRKQLRLNAGDKLDFRVEKDGSLRVVPRTMKASEVVGILTRKGQKPMSVEDMDRAIVGMLRKKHSR